MAWTPYQILLSVVLVVTGSINTLTTKWADRLESVGSNGVSRNFNHPFVQSLAMFIGEMTCLAAFKLIYFYYKKKDNSQDERNLVKGNRNFKIWIFFIPAMCDMIATSIMYIGLTLTYASSFQMLRGSLIVFVAMLSVGFLGRKVNSREWTGIFFVIIGLAIVGLSDFYLNKSSASINNVITGDLLIILAQIISAVQIVAEEHFVSGQDVPPLQAVGWEGTFGFVVLGILLIPFYYIYIGQPFSTNPLGRVEDLKDALIQIENNPLLVVAIMGTIVSIAFFNFAGISVTKEISATTRTVLDSVRTLFIWMVTVALGWQDFSVIQIFGFILLVFGMCIYNDVLVTRVVGGFATWWCSRRANRDQMQETLINQPADETNNP